MSDENDDDIIARARREFQQRIEAAGRLVLSHEDFRFDVQQEKFWLLYTGQLMSADTVSSRIDRARWTTVEAANGRERGIPPAMEIRAEERGLTVHSSTWWPGQPQIISNMFASEAGIRPKAGAMLYNVYHPPELPKTRMSAEPWINHVKALWPKPIEHNYFFDYCAHMIQKPGEKTNAGIVLSGEQGTGKDAALVPLKLAVGISNAQNISPDELFASFNPWIQSVMLIVDEARSQSDEHKATSMYNVLKPLCAAPPDFIRVNAKYMAPRYIVNCCRLFMTTNEVDGLYLPHDDRRIFLLHTEARKQDTQPYMAEYWAWARSCGGSAVRQWLLARSLEKFDANAAPPKTDKHIEVGSSWGIDPESGTGWLFSQFAGDDGQMPKVLLPSQLRDVAKERGFDYAAELNKSLSPRAINRTMTRAGYSTVSPVGGEKEWRWEKAADGKKFSVRAQAGYRRHDVPISEAREAIQELGAALLEAKFAFNPKLAVVKSAG